MLSDIRGDGHGAVEAAAALPGLSAWIATLTAAELDLAYGVGAADAAMVMALDGDSIISFPDGVKRRTIARPAWEDLAVQYAQSSAAEEAALYRAAGAEDVGIAYVADTSPEALRQSGGALALLAWPEKGS